MKFTAKDIRIKSMVQHKAILWINSFPLDGTDDETNSKLLKQQILSEHEVVKIIRSYKGTEIFDLLMIDSKLKSILEKPNE